MINKIVCNAEDLTAIADAVRTSTGSTETYNVPELSAAAVNAIGNGGVTIDNTLTVSGKAADAKATGDRLAALSEEIAKLTQGGGGASVQSDWSVNDESNPAYVKNRTHWLERPYEPIVWNGNTEGRDSVDVGPVLGYPAGMAFAYKLSDHILSKEEMAVSVVDATAGGMELTGNIGEVFDIIPNAVWYADFSCDYHDVEHDEITTFASGRIIVTTVSGDFSSSLGTVIPSTGTYILHMDSYTIADRFSINGDVYHAIDKRYLPAAFATEEYVNNAIAQAISGAIGGSY